MSDTDCVEDCSIDVDDSEVDSSEDNISSGEEVTTKEPIEGIILEGTGSRMKKKILRKLSTNDEFLNSQFGKKATVPRTTKAYKRCVIELAGEEVMQHLIELGRTTNLSFYKMSERINEVYSLKTTKNHIRSFFLKNVKALDTIYEEEKSLRKARARMILEHNIVLVDDIKKLDKMIDEMTDKDNDSLLSCDQRAKIVGDLIDKKGKLLMRYAKLSGNLEPDPANNPNTTNINNLQQNITINNEKTKSELIQKLKKVEFKEPKKVVDDPVLKDVSTTNDSLG